MYRSSDVAIISAAQKVKHYEIASYGTLRTLAGTLGYSEAKSLSDKTLAEENNADSFTHSGSRELCK
ncbi:hypothetical protein GCM10023149_21620 [Mucilaginibacter gynuensis]|uniref:DUF892 family protein n=1 Tax=Mucilaginibacter gynuensis TaxID=1302236 RepID=A0ABP8GCB4_9SPHI